VNKFQNLNNTPSDGKVTEGDLDLFRDVMTDEAVVALRLRNECRAEEAKQILGDRWLLHPSNAATRKPVHV
jgi:hypothetical protein